MKRPVGAGGTEGGIGRFFMGLIMMVAGGYLFLNNIQVGHSFHMGTRSQPVDHRRIQYNFRICFDPFYFWNRDGFLQFSKLLRLVSISRLYNNVRFWCYFKRSFSPETHDGI